MKYISNLEILDLSGNYIKDKGMKNLGRHFSQISNLQYLNISCILIILKIMNLKIKVLRR